MAVYQLAFSAQVSHTDFRSRQYMRSRRRAAASFESGRCVEQQRQRYQMKRWRIVNYFLIDSPDFKSLQLELFL